MLETARHQWEDGARRLAETRADGPRYLQLAALVDVVVDELRRRVGQTYSLGELADAYRGSEEWVREVVVEATPRRDARAGLPDSTVVQDAAFAQYARGATDYAP
jgi:hypothetical protein